MDSRLHKFAFEVQVVGEVEQTIVDDAVRKGAQALHEALSEVEGIPTLVVVWSGPVEEPVLHTMLDTRDMPVAEHKRGPLKKKRP